MDISFYHLTTTSLEKTLPKLLEKAHALGQRAVVVMDSDERLENMDSVLWTYASLAFLPHGSAKLPKHLHNQQPIWLTTSLENPNQASLLVVTDGQEIPADAPFLRCLDVFDGTHSNAQQAAQNRLNHYVARGDTCVYWQQTLEGGWQKQ